MLKREQAKLCQRRRLGVAEYAENAAFFFEFI